MRAVIYTITLVMFLIMLSMSGCKAYDAVKDALKDKPAPEAPAPAQ